MKFFNKSTLRVIVEYGAVLKKCRENNFCSMKLNDEHLSKGSILNFHDYLFSLMEVNPES